MPITDRNLPHGAVLVATYKKTTITCEVLVGTDGVTQFLLASNAQTYKSPSAAAAAVTGGAVNGWKFWSVSGDRTSSPAPAPAPARKAKASRVLDDGPVNDGPLPEGWIWIPADPTPTLPLGYKRGHFEEAMATNTCEHCQGPLMSANGGFCTTGYPVQAVCSACKAIYLESNTDREVVVPSKKGRKRV